jgi:L-lactate dehydrogenase complex protein LldG
MSSINDRVLVMTNVRSALGLRREERAALPDWEESLVVSQPVADFASAEAMFRQRFQAAGGVLAEGWAALRALLAERGVRLGWCDPALLPYMDGAGFELEAQFDRARVDEYEFGISRATFGIGETGSLVLTESGTASRLGALAPWLHVAVLDRQHLLGTLPEAISRLGQERVVIFVTGPSKTADVEGILIKGVHGPGVQVCCLV